MTQASLLKTLYIQSSFNRNTPLRALLDAYIEGSCLEERLIAEALTCPSLPLSSFAEHLVLEKWREFLTLIFIFYFRGCLDAYKLKSLKYMRALKRFSLWKGHQLFSIYHELAVFLLNQEARKVILTQLPNGACSVEVDGYRSTGALPHPLFHAELGTLWCLYGDLTGQSLYVEAAFKLAKWQSNTLDHHFLSFVGLFASEGQVSERLLLVNNFLLFNALARTNQCSEMAFLAKKQIDQLMKLANSESIDMACHGIIFEEYFSKKVLPMSSRDYCLPAAFKDEHFAIAGLRSAESSAVATLNGEKSGMGCYHFKDVNVMSFGPQHIPLGDCKGFGISGSSSLLSDNIKTLSIGDDQFLIEGVARLSSSCSQDLSLFPHAGWVTSRQEFNKGRLAIEINFQGLFEQDDLVFSFFIKCKSCLVDGSKMVRKRSLNRYSGQSASVTLEGMDGSIVLEAKQFHPEMHVIPLGGGDNFWGADFLVAYLLNDNLISYSWQLTP